MVELSAMTDGQLLDHCDWLTDSDPIELLREVIPFLIKERADANEIAMQHQCTPDYELGYIHGERSTIQVCRLRYGKCKHD